MPQASEVLDFMGRRAMGALQGTIGGAGAGGVGGGVVSGAMESRRQTHTGDKDKKKLWEAVGEGALKGAKSGAKAGAIGGAILGPTMRKNQHGNYEYERGRGVVLGTLAGGTQGYGVGKKRRGKESDKIVYNKDKKKEAARSRLHVPGVDDKSQSHWEELAKQRGTKDIPGGLITPAWMVERNNARVEASGRGKLWPRDGRGRKEKAAMLSPLRILGGAARGATTGAITGGATGAMTGKAQGANTEELVESAARGAVMGATLGGIVGAAGGVVDMPGYMTAGGGVLSGVHQGLVQNLGTDSIKARRAEAAEAGGSQKTAGWKLPAAIGAAGVATTAAGTAIGAHQGHKKGRTKGRREGYQVGHHVGGRRGYVAGQKAMLDRIREYQGSKDQATREVAKAKEVAKEKTGSDSFFPVLLLTSLLP